MQLLLPLWAASEVEASRAPGQAEEQELYCVEDRHIRALGMGLREMSAASSDSSREIQWSWRGTVGKVASGDTR